MQVTRRYWATVGFSGLLAGAAIVLAQPLLVVGAAGLGAWLLGQHLLFTWTTRCLQQEVRVTQTLARDHVAVDEPVTASLTAELAYEPPLPVDITIQAGVPLSATAAEDGTATGTRHLTLARSETEAATTLSVTWPVAGRDTFDAPTVTVTDDSGLFQAAFADQSGFPPTITVRPRQPHALHIGTGGEPTTTILGDHQTTHQGAGIEPASVREYVPSDTLRQIDWKATARSDQLYVRTFTDETEYGTAVIVDQRAAMQRGPPGESKLAYAREVALAVVDHAATQGDAVGLAAVGDAGITERQPPGATPDTYAHLRTVLHDLTPTQATTPTQSQSATRQDSATAATDTHAHPASATASPRDARRTADALAGDDSAFATSLRPFFARAQTYVQRIAADPLYATVQSYLTTGGGTDRQYRPDRTIILTDDTNRAEVREAVNIARQDSDQVLVFLTPTVLFEPAGLGDVEAAYTRYTKFETFRQHLTRLDDVTAFEVAPGDRLATLQAATRTPTSTTSR